MKKANKSDSWNTISLEGKVAAVYRIQAGETMSAIARELGVHRGTVVMWVSNYRDYGAEGLRPRWGDHKTAEASR